MHLLPPHGSPWEWGLWNATLLPSEKGFYAFAFLLAIFGAIAVQKNTRDSQQATKKDN
jgi:hypothetical protein